MGREERGKERERKGDLKRRLVDAMCAVCVLSITQHILANGSGKNNRALLKTTTGL